MPLPGKGGVKTMAGIPSTPEIPRVPQHRIFGVKLSEKSYIKQVVKHCQKFGMQKITRTNAV